MADNSNSAPPDKPRRKNGPGRPFVKGQPSANPGGRPKLVQEFQKALRERCYDKAIDTLVGCLDDPDGRVRVAALREVFDRMFGKAKVTLAGEDGQPAVVAVDLASALERLAGDG